MALFCTRCRCCETDNVDLDGKACCIFCEDGVACPGRKRQAAAPTYIPPRPAKPRAKASNPHPQQQQEPDRTAAPIEFNQETEPMPEPTPANTTSSASGTAHCKAPDCPALTRSKVGYCAKHFHLSRKKEPGKVCSVEGCGKTLRSHNHTGRCTMHFYRPKGLQAAKPPANRRPNGVTTKVAKSRKPNGGPDPLTETSDPRLPIFVSEPQLDELFHKMPMADKAACIDAWLAGKL